MSLTWKAVFPALWTSTDATGRLLRDQCVRQIHFLRDAGCDGVMVLGTTGEFPHLDFETRREVIQLAVETVPDQPVIANCSAVNPHQVAQLGRHAREIGARAISLLPPWYYAVSPEDAAEFLVRGAEAAGLPLLLYNFPERTGHRLSIETIAAVCERVQVVGLKQSGAEFEYHRELAELGQKKGFVLITGSDTRIPEAFGLGARGVVSGLANAAPEWVVASFRAMQQGDGALAAQFANRLQAMVKAVGGLECALDVRAAMEARGAPIGEFKQVMSASSMARFKQAVEQCRAVMAAEGLPLLGAA